MKKNNFIYVCTLLILASTLLMYCPYQTPAHQVGPALPVDLEAPQEIAERTLKQDIADQPDATEESRDECVRTLSTLLNPNMLAILTLSPRRKPDVSLIPPTLIAAAKKAQVEGLSVEELEVLSQGIVAFYKALRVAYSNDFFYARVDLPDFSCGENKILKITTPLSTVCPIYKSIIYSERLLHTILQICLGYAPGRDMQVNITNQVRSSLISIIGLKQTYATEFSNGSEELLNFILDLHDAFQLEIDNMLNEE